MTNNNSIPALANNAVRKLCNDLNAIENIMWHGSIVQGKQARNGTDVDIVLSLDNPSSASSNHSSGNGVPKTRLDSLNFIATKLQNFSHQALTELGLKTDIPLSCLILTKAEVDWDIVKDCSQFDFFSKPVVRAIAKGSEKFFQPCSEYRCRREVLNSRNGPWIPFAKAIQGVQLTRKQFCNGEFNNHTELEKSFKNLLRCIAQAFRSSEDLNVGYQELRRITGAATSKSSIPSLNDNFTLPLDAPFTPDQLMLMWEYLLDAALEKLDELIPPIDKILRDYQASIQKQWLSQWGYATNKNGEFVTAISNGVDVIKDPSSDAPVRVLNSNNEAIIQENGLNTGSIQYADLFDKYPDSFGPTHLEDEQPKR
jgi:hypothetical protein